MRDRRRKRNGGPGGREKGRRDSWCGWIERDQYKLLSTVWNGASESINKFWNALLVSNWKTALNFLSISISEKVTWTGSDEGRQGGSQMKRKRKMISFYFLNFFVNRLYSFLPSSLLNARLCFHVIHPHLIIQHKVSFSSRFISFFLF